MKQSVRRLEVECADQPRILGVARGHFDVTTTVKVMIVLEPFQSEFEKPSVSKLTWKLFPEVSREISERFTGVKSSLLSGSFLIKFSSISPTKIEELQLDQTKKHSAVRSSIFVGEEEEIIKHTFTSSMLF